MTTLCLGVVVLCLSASPLNAQTSPTAEFELAENSFDFQDYARAAELYHALLYPKLRIQDSQALIARERLGASYWFLEKTREAEQEFRGLLNKYKEHRLDPFFYPPELIQFYNEVLAEMQRVGMVPKTPESDKDAIKTRTIEREIVENTSLITAFVPFGVGQFLNGDNVAGTTFLATETLALAGTLASYYLLIDTAPVDPDLAENYETAFWVSQSIFWGLAITGIIDAAIHHQGHRVRRETLEIPIEPPSDDLLEESHLTPTLGFTPRNGVFVGLSGKFGRD
jgi:hypothetical protein